MESEACLHKNKKFSAGEQVCEEDRCFVCRDRVWEERFIDLISGVGP